MVTIKLDGIRRDVEELFKLSGLREFKKLSHHPLIVIQDDILELCFDAKTLIEKYKEDSEVLYQWEGKWKSDFFYFKIKTFKDYIAKNPKEDYYII